MKILMKISQSIRINQRVFNVSDKIFDAVDVNFESMKNLMQKSQRL